MSSLKAGSKTAAKAFVAALVPFVIAIALAISTGGINDPELVLAGSGVLNLGFVYFIPNGKILNTAKAVLAGLTPLVVAVLSGTPASDLTVLVVPLLTTVLVWATSNDSDASDDSEVRYTNVTLNRAHY